MQFHTVSTDQSASRTRNTYFIIENKGLSCTQTPAHVWEWQMGVAEVRIKYWGEWGARGHTEMTSWDGGHVQAVRWWMLNNGTHRGIQECFCAPGRSRLAIWIGAVWRLWEKQREFLHRGLERPPLQSALCATFPNISTDRKRERECFLKQNTVENLPIFGWFRIFIILTSLKSWKRRQKKIN